MTGTLSVATDGTTTQTLGDGTDYGGSGSHRKGHRYERKILSIHKVIQPTIFHRICELVLL